MRLRRKIGWTAAAIFGPLLLALGVAPYAVDVEAYKPAIIQAVRDATGRELVIDGPVRLRMFPVPGIGAGEVHFSNAVGAKGAQMVDVRWVAVRPSWWALLLGRVEVGTLTLYRPTIVLETDAEGRPNWDFTPGAGTAQAAGAASAGFHLAIGRLSLVRGTVTYTNPQSGKTFSAEDVNASATAGSFDGPFTIEGSATVNGVPLKLDLEVGAPSAKGHATTLALQVSSGKLDFTGELSAISNDMRVTGHLAVETGRLTDFVAAMVSATGSDRPFFEAPLVGRFTFDGGIDVGPDRIAISDFAATMGRDTATGSLALTYDGPPTLQGHLELANLDLEKWLELLSKHGLFAPPAPQPAKPAVPAAAATTLPVQMNASLTVDVAEMAYRHDKIRDLSLAIDVDKGVIVVPRFKATLPGDMAVEGSSGPAGSFSLSGARLRDTLAWLGVDTAGVPDDRLQSLEASGKMATTKNGFQVSAATFELDDMKGKGGGTITFGPPISATVTVDADRFDLDAYMPRPAAELALPTMPTLGANPAATATPPSGPPPAAAAPSLGLKAKIAKLVFRGETLAGVDGDAAVQGNVLKLGNLQVANLLGARLGLKGTINDFATGPRFDLSFNASAPDTDRLLGYVGLPGFLNGKIGAATATGSVAGTLGSVTLRDVNVGFLGATGRASGTLAFGAAFAFNFPSFSLQASDIGRLASVASGRGMSGLGALSASGSLSGASQKATFNGNLVARGSQMNGTIDATLGQRPKIAATLHVPGTLDLDQWLGVSAGPPSTASAGGHPTVNTAGVPTPFPNPGAASGTPIDLGALRSFDAALTVFTSSMSVASLKINYCDFNATLTNGVLRLAKLTGQFYGGGVNFAGTIDASGSALSINLAGDVIGIFFGELLRGTAGTNNFGNNDLMVSIDGKINATGIKMAGRGRSAQEIRNGLSGAAAVSGYLYPAVIKGSQGFAQFASSLGSIFSEGMAFNSLILQSFVSNQNSLSGQLQFNGGKVTTQNETVQGRNATAVITSNTDIVAATTDTVVRVNGGNGSFVATIKGPLAAPSLTTARASGN